MKLKNSETFYKEQETIAITEHKHMWYYILDRLTNLFEQGERKAVNIDVLKREYMILIIDEENLYIKCNCFLCDFCDEFDVACYDCPLNLDNCADYYKARNCEKIHQQIQFAHSICFAERIKYEKPNK